MHFKVAYGIFLHTLTALTALNAARKNC